MVLLLLVLLPATASAHYDFIKGGIYYEILSDSTVGVSYNSVGGTLNNQEYRGDVVIPESVTNSGNTYTVTAILSQALYFCQDVTSLSIPRTVVSISHNSIVACGGLQSIVVAEDNPVYDSRGGCNALIETASNVLLKGSCNTVIPDGIKKIGQGAFKYCLNLTSINIPSTVTHIESDAFWYTGLTGIHIPASVSYIAEGSFASCSNMGTVTVAEDNPVYDSREGCNAIIETATGVLIMGSNNSVIPDGVTAIARYAFSGRNSLSQLVFPSSLTSIGSQAFRSCSSLTELTFPSSVEIIGEEAFGYCRGVTRIDLSECSIDALKQYVFQYCSGLTDIIFPSGLKRIESMALYNCTSLENVVLPDGVESVASNAFNGTPWRDNQPEGLVYSGNVLMGYQGTLPADTCLAVREGTRTIADNAFYNKSGLKGITLPSSLRYIGSSVFYKCTSLGNVQFPDSLVEIGKEAFYDCEGLTEVVLPDGLKRLGKNAFNVCKNLTDLTIGSSLEELDCTTFSTCSALRNITVAASNPHFDSRGGCNAVIETATGVLVLGCSGTVVPDGVTSIGQNAFYNSTVEHVVLPSSLTSISGSAFRFCHNLQDVVFSNTLTSIGAYAFHDCNMLTSIVLPNSVTSIGSSAFLSCSSLINVTLPESITMIASYAFSSCKKLSAIVIPNTVTAIESYAFSNCNALADIVFPESLEAVGTKAFENTAWYRSQPTGIVYAGPVLYIVKGTLPEDTVIVVPEGVRGIAGQAFWNTGGRQIAGIKLPQSLRTIGDEAFRYDFRLKEIIIPDKVTTIGRYAFDNCRVLTTVKLGKALTSVGEYAFQYCRELKSVTCMAREIPTLTSNYGDTYCFYGATLYVPEARVEEYRAAEGWCDFATIVGLMGAGPGDLNGDGRLSVSDVAGLINAIINYNEDSSINPNADVDGDGRVSVRDITILIDMILNSDD